MVGLYTLPLLIWHPMQLVLGTAVAPRVNAYVKRREKELAEQQQQENGSETDGDVVPRVDSSTQLMELGEGSGSNENASD